MTIENTMPKASELFDAGETTEVATVETPPATPVVVAEAPKEPIAPTNTKAISVTAQEDGRLVGTTVEEQYRMARYYHSAKLLPAAFDTPEKILTGLQFCYELGLKPLTAIRQICVINGTPSLWGDLPLSLVLNSGKLAEMTEIVFDKKGQEISRANGNLSEEPYGAECVTIRKDLGRRVTTVFTMDDAARAGLINKNRSLYKVYPKRMLQMRARSQNLKDNFADVLNGAAIAEYDFHTEGSDDPIEIELDSARRGNVAAALNDKFSKKTVAVEEKPS